MARGGAGNEAGGRPRGWRAHGRVVGNAGSRDAVRAHRAPFGRAIGRLAAARGRAAAGLLALTLAVAGCVTLQQIAALRQVDFALDRVSDARLAGVSLSRIANYED